MTPDKKRQATCSHLVRLLREEREKQGISMTTLAASAGLSQQMVSYVEREMRVPTIDTLLRIAAALNTELWTVLQAAAREAQSQKRRSKKD